MTPEELVSKQHELYNLRDVDAYMELWADNGELIDMATRDVIVQGRDAIRKHYEKRFTESPDLSCKVVKRICHGDWIIDHELVDGIGDDTLEVVAVYRVADGLIESISFLYA